MSCDAQSHVVKLKFMTPLNNTIPSCYSPIFCWATKTVVSIPLYFQVLCLTDWSNKEVQHQWL